MSNPAQPAGQVLVVSSTKSVGIAILLTVLFGPLGMLYSTVLGAVVMIIVSVVTALLTFGLGLLVTWPVCVIWGAAAATSHNKKLLSGARQY